MSRKRPEGTVSVDFQGLAPSQLAQKSLGDAARGYTRPEGTVIDAAVHPRPRSGELQKYLPAIWKQRRLPPGERYYYPNVLGDYVKESYAEGGPPGSDFGLVSQHLFEDMGIDLAILVPLTLGLLPDADLLAAICGATNQWLAETWLARDARYRGTIRISPNHPQAAVAEIEKWATHPGFVQIGVPLQSMQLYGNAFFLPIWEAAARHSLPVLMHSDAETGVELAPTPGGYFRHYLGYASYQPLTFVSHLTSMMAGGVFDHLPALRVIFGDGGWDMCAPFIWRLDKDYRPMRADMPWMKKIPSDYIADHVRFIAHDLEGPEDPKLMEEWLKIADGKQIVMFGSNYPNWNLFHPSAAFAGIEPALRRRILSGTAAELYGLSASSEDRRQNVEIA